MNTPYSIATSQEDVVVAYPQNQDVKKVNHGSTHCH